MIIWPSGSADYRKAAAAASGEREALAGLFRPPHDCKSHNDYA